MVKKKTNPAHWLSHHVNIKGKITFWDRLGILISGNKNMLFIQFCKEVPKASKPSSNTRTSHPHHSQIPAHLPWLQQQFLPPGRKWDKAGGKGWHSPCTKWHQKATSHIPASVSPHPLCISKWELLCCDVFRLFKAADLCCYKQELALNQVLHQGMNTFPLPNPVM